ncbi:ABC transporter permease [Mycoplasmatota bacterium zrk1]
MKNKFKFLVGFSLRRKIERKSFLISNIVLLILVILISNLDTVITSFGGDFDDVYTIYYEDDLEENYFDMFSLAVKNGPFQGKNDLIVINESYTLEADDKNVIVVKVNEGEEITAKISSNDLVSTTLYSSIYSTLNGIKMDATATKLNINQEDISKLLKQISIEREVFNDEGKNEESEALLGGLSFIVIMPFFFGILMIVQMIGLEIFDEKSTKSMEVIMSSVEPKVHLLSKLAAVNIFAIIQFVLLVLYGVIGVLIRSFFAKMSFSNASLPFDINLSSYSDRIVGVIIIITILFLLTNLLYSLCMAILASTANEMDDYQKIISPIMILMVLGFYTAIFSPLFDGAVFAKIMSHIPFFTLMIAPGLFISGDISVLEIIIIFLIHIVTLIAIYSIGIPAYKQSVLDYSNDGVFKRFIKNIRSTRKIKLNK